ncbi:hypothetical protein IAI51_13535 [Pseudomonas sp. N40(2020)]|uniref:hypothetical protein n=1 Tax=Pseudomonas sp. N40(2020) TaxID=2767798 RepID=UPI001656D381|nr:hypothetical protein [Pseudomonas sp. N40(2020)]MBC8997552.1 hypothetical protein [Pseudomonas sp. N40(2020)]
MTDPNKGKGGTFNADVNGSGYPLFVAETADIVLKEPPDGNDYWQGIGSHTVGELPVVNTYLSVYVVKNTKPGTYRLEEHKKTVWASYGVQTAGNIEAYFSVSGEVKLTVVPSDADQRLEGTLSFTAEYNDRQVHVSNGQFNLTKTNQITSSLLDTPRT